MNGSESGWASRRYPRYGGHGIRDLDAPAHRDPLDVAALAAYTAGVEAARAVNRARGVREARANERALTTDTEMTA